MRCVECGSEAITERRERTAQGYRPGLRVPRIGRPVLPCPRLSGDFGPPAADELRDFLRPQSRYNQHVPTDRRRSLFLGRTATVLAILEAA